MLEKKIENGKRTVVVAMSGGVDSSVCAYLLKNAGYNVIGATMSLHKKSHEDSITDAKKVAEKLDIEHHVFYLEDIFKEKVIDPFIDEYLNGHTPNPCVLCNKHLKWEQFLTYSQKLGADLIATGHYAQIISYNGRLSVAKAKYDNKDQAYALYAVSQECLEKTLMPCGTYTKEEIRKIAKEAELPVYNKPDSQDICFVENNDYSKFIRENSNKEPKKGLFVNENGKTFGGHKGICNYTIGQRKGLGVSYTEPLYVLSIIPETGNIVLGQEKNLFKDSLIINNVNYMGIQKIDNNLECLGKIRYAANFAKCTLTPIENGEISVKFDEPQRAITKGQSAVFYSNDETKAVLLGGIIK